MDNTETYYFITRRYGNPPKIFRDKQRFVDHAIDLEDVGAFYRAYILNCEHSLSEKQTTAIAKILETD